MELSREEAELQTGLGGRVDVEVVDGVAVLRIRCGENRWNKAYLDRLNAALDQVESDPSVTALVTIGEGRFYCNGLDLQWMGPLSLQPSGAQRLLAFRDDMLHPFIWRLTTFPMPTVAAINGHCYAAGVLQALCHDRMVMREDRGWFCMNEVFTGLPLSPVVQTLLRLRLSAPNVAEVGVLGKRYTARELLASGIIQAAAKEADLLSTAIAAAKDVASRGYARENLQNMKSLVFSPLKNAMEDFRGKDEGDPDKFAKARL